MPRGVYVRKPKEKEPISPPVVIPEPEEHPDNFIEAVIPRVVGPDWTKQVFPGMVDAQYGGIGSIAEATRPEPPPPPDPNVYCRRCGQPMQCYGNLEGKIIPMNPPAEDATWACHDCKVRRKIRRDVDVASDWREVRLYELEA